MKKALAISLSDEELLELCRILIDQDEAGALAFLDRHLKKKVNQVLEGGGKVLIEVPGAGVVEAGGHPIGRR